MLIRKLLPFFIAVSLIVPAFAFSEVQEMKDYKVKGGDTLWDISTKELQDPFLWPKNLERKSCHSEPRQDIS